MNHIVYKTTNLVNKKIYVGVHKQHSTDFDGYLGSGTAIKWAVDKYGKHNFIRETIHECTTREEAFLLESKIVDKKFMNRKDVYNMSLGGKGSPGVSPSAETRAKISYALKGRIFSESHKQKIGEANRKREWTSETRKKMSSSGLGRIMSAETKRKMSLAKSAKRLPQKIVTCPHCNKEGGINAMLRWHFDNCKLVITSPLSLLLV